MIDLHALGMLRPDQRAAVVPAGFRGYGPPPPPAPPTRQGQREIVAATLAAAVIAADHGRAPTVEAAVELMREVVAVAWPDQG